MNFEIYNLEAAFVIFAKVAELSNKKLPLQDRQDTDIVFDSGYVRVHKSQREIHRVRILF